MIEKTLQRILYAEDEEDIRAVAQIALEDIGGFTVKYCTTGLEALETVIEFKPDLLLFDVMMPQMDGVTTLKEIRKNTELDGIPAIFMTAKIQPSEVAEYKAMGVVDVISKPFDPMKLSDNIKKVWTTYLAQKV